MRRSVAKRLAGPGVQKLTGLVLLRMTRMNLLPDVLRVLDHSLSLKGRALAFQGNTRLLGDLPELDSMAVLAFIEGLESHFGVTFRDDSITSDSFATVDSVCALVQSAIDEQGT